MVISEWNREQFEANPALFLESAIKGYVATSPGNRFSAFNDEPIWEEPLVAFADGDEALFRDYKTVVGDFHLTPREALQEYLEDEGSAGDGSARRVSVISWVLPVSRATRLSLRRESRVPALRWNHTRWHGQDFIYELSRYLVSLLEKLGQRAVAPELAKSFRIKELPDGLASSWSQRHIAYAAGLGTFSLSDGFITPRGIALRCGSVVTDSVLPPSPRRYESHLANCLYYREGSCGRCIQRCPADAISWQGHDKKKCREFLNVEQRAILRELGRDEGYIGHYPGCGLCQTKVPCESMIPPGILHKNEK